MLLANRRIALLHLLLALMQATWISAFFLLAWPRPLSSGSAYHRPRPGWSAGCWHSSC